MLYKDNGRGQIAIWECDVCGKHFEKSRPRAREQQQKGQRSACSKSCNLILRQDNLKNITNKHDINAPRKGYGITIDGYLWIYVNDNSIRHNQMKLHRYLMEIKLGRKIKPTEIVHHIDGNKFNNDIRNLKIVSRSEHNRIHGFFKGDINESKRFVKTSSETKILERKK